MQSAVGGIVAGLAMRIAGIFLALVFVVGDIARGEDRPLAASPRMLLDAAAKAVPNDRSIGKQAAAWLEAGVKGELLMRHGRLLPQGISVEETARLAAALRDRDPAHESSLQELLATLPKADDLAFDGQHYAGGNLNYIDSMLGQSGRPIAFDRELPALLVPLAPEADAALAEKRVAFQAGEDTLKVRETANENYGEGAGALLFADGQFLREYAGRFDDLYVHLFQNGNGASALAFCGLADGLAGRVYQTVNGLRRQGSVPATKFDLDDILSDGGKAAVRRHLGAQSDRVGVPFKRFAFHVLPSIVGKTRTLPVGARFTATEAEIQQALRTRQHIYPTQVPPLYRSADRFFGWTGSFIIRAANKVALPPGAADSWYPLPARSGETSADAAADGVASTQLFESSSTSDIVWEDPQLSNLLADPEEPAEPSKAPPAKSATPNPPSPKVESDPRRRETKARLIAVVTPTVHEAEEYRSAIAANDDQLRAIEQTRGRIRLLRQFIEGARAGSTVIAPERESRSSAGPLEQAMAADFTSFEERESELAARLQVVLQERAGLRSELEKRLQRERVRPLQELGKKDGEAEAGLSL